MRTRLAVLFLIVAAMGMMSFAQTQEIDIPYQRFVLNNGLTVIVHEDHKAPIVAINMWYHVGSKNETRGRPDLLTYSSTSCSAAVSTHPAATLTRWRESARRT